jgi:membrane protein YqaA with SNARE-associated domain
MADSLLASLGLYGATFVIALVAGLFPIVSIELFLVGATALGVDVKILAVLVGIAVVGHQIAKTVTYYAGAGALELPRGALRARIAAATQRLERWNKRPRLVMFAAASIGLPPLFVLGYLARPVMKMEIATFTALSLTGRVLRYGTLVAITALI